MPSLLWKSLLISLANEPGLVWRFNSSLISEYFFGDFPYDEMRPFPGWCRVGFATILKTWPLTPLSVCLILNVTMSFRCHSFVIFESSETTLRPSHPVMFTDLHFLSPSVFHFSPTGISRSRLSSTKNFLQALVCSARKLFFWHAVLLFHDKRSWNPYLFL